MCVESLQSTPLAFPSSSEGWKPSSSPRPLPCGGLGKIPWIIKSCHCQWLFLFLCFFFLFFNSGPAILREHEVRAKSSPFLLKNNKKKNETKKKRNVFIVSKAESLRLLPSSGNALACSRTRKKPVPLFRESFSLSIYTSLALVPCSPEGFCPLGGGVWHWVNEELTLEDETRLQATVASGCWKEDRRRWWLGV